MKKEIEVGGSGAGAEFRHKKHPLGWKKENGVIFKEDGYDGHKESLDDTLESPIVYAELEYILSFIKYNSRINDIVMLVGHKDDPYGTAMWRINTKENVDKMRKEVFFYCIDCNKEFEFFEKPHKNPTKNIKVEKGAWAAICDPCYEKRLKENKSAEIME